MNDLQAIIDQYRYHPAEQPEIEVTAIWMEPAGNNVWVPESKDHDEWARDWADDHLDELMVEAHR